jgi:hypothetical protein
MSPAIDFIQQSKIGRFGSASLASLSSTIFFLSHATHFLSFIPSTNTTRCPVNQHNHQLTRVATSWYLQVGLEHHQDRITSIQHWIPQYVGKFHPKCLPTQRVLQPANESTVLSREPTSSNPIHRPPHPVIRYLSSR